MNFCNVLCFFAGEAIFFKTMSWVLSLAAFYQLQSTFSNKEQRTNQSVIYYRCSGTTINGNVKCSQNQCIGKSNILYLIWYHFKNVILWNFDVRNRNAENSLEKRNDSPKIGMVGISVIRIIKGPECIRKLAEGIKGYGNIVI